MECHKGLVHVAHLTFQVLNLPSLKLTFSHLKMDGWNTFSFPIGAFRPIFRCENVSFRERNTPQRIRETTLFLVSRHSPTEMGSFLHGTKSQRRDAGLASYNKIKGIGYGCFQK